MLLTSEQKENYKQSQEKKIRWSSFHFSFAYRLHKFYEQLTVFLQSEKFCEN